MAETNDILGFNPNSDPNTLQGDESLGILTRRDQLLSTEQVPLEPLSALCYYLDKYRIIETDQNLGVNESGMDFLSKGVEVNIPYQIELRGVTIPYRIYPIAAKNVINAAVKTLEKDLRSKMENPSSGLDQKTLLGIATLADSLFTGTCSHPDEPFIIHRPDPKTGKVVLNSTGRRIVQLSSRLKSWKNTLEEINKVNNIKFDLPALTCEEVLRQEISSALQRWRMSQSQVHRAGDFGTGYASLESLKEQAGYEPSYEPIPGEEEAALDYEEQLQDYTQEVAQSQWIELQGGSGLGFEETSRGNIITENPKNWIWNNDESPLEFILDYVIDNSKPCLEEAHSLLVQASEDQMKIKAGSLGLILDSKNKNNPDSYWKIIKRISSKFPRPRREMDTTTTKLDTARFVLSLSAINRKFNVDESKFQEAFEKRIYEKLDSGSWESTTRNAMLLETIAELYPEWDKIKRDQWLESLQTYAVGAYENSIAMEKERRKLLSRLNHLFGPPRLELSKVRTNSTNSEIKPQDIEVVNKVLKDSTIGFYEYLSGKTGQMTRRELRTKIQEMKERADATGNIDLSNYLATMNKFVSSISSQIKSGDWYENKDQNQSIIYNFLSTMVETPIDKNRPEFLGSKEPEGKDPLEITIDFLRAYANEKEFPPGKQKIEGVLGLWKERQLEDEGGELAKALSEITKNKTETISAIRERSKALEGAIIISENLAKSTEPIPEMTKTFEKELELLELTDKEKSSLLLPDPFNEPNCPVFAENQKLSTGLDEALVWMKERTELLTARVEQFKSLKTNSTSTIGKDDLEKAIALRNVATRLLDHSVNKTKEQESQCLEYIKESKRFINLRLEESLKFWKGINYISQNIQSRREEDRFQVTPSGKGSLQNIIAITKARIADKENLNTPIETRVDTEPSSINSREFGESKEQNVTNMRQFKLTTTRKRTIVFNVAVPIGLWLSEKERGTKTRITQKEFIEALKARKNACEVCLKEEEINSESNLEERLEEYRKREKDDKYVANLHILDQCLQMVEDKENLLRGIKVINQDANWVREIGKNEQAPDTPNEIAQQYKNIVSPEASLGYADSTNAEPTTSTKITNGSKLEKTSKSNKTSKKEQEMMLEEI